MIFRAISTLLIGTLCGWLAGEIMHNRGNWVRNFSLGILGSIVGGFLSGILGIYTHDFSIGAIIINVAGACLCIWFAQKYIK